MQYRTINNMTMLIRYIQFQLVYRIYRVKYKYIILYFTFLRVVFCQQLSNYSNQRE